MLSKIMCNFFSVITLYPAATMVYEYYFYDSKAKKNCCLATCGCCKKEKGFNATEGESWGRFVVGSATCRGFDIVRCRVLYVLCESDGAFEDGKRLL